ncbi:strawberry notch C-terminal domain-containing protein [Microvirga puerhi]|uniref:Strawberry notch family protein n=1 Tax=Microvirga puerhi TaxID=2876078 RepID=A0ABS7VUX3_9HYPH|nr:strawberry notch C-terminal domain-containing protein [Microvirga puerhi]MBZ6078925.1 strawberry notch family protein [Microvirga puerhi]
MVGIAPYRFKERAAYLDLDSTAEITNRYLRFKELYPSLSADGEGRFLITNRFGEDIIEASGGERSFVSKNGRIVSEYEINTPSRFFRATDGTSFRECAAHIAVAMLRGSPLQRDDLTRYLVAAGGETLGYSVADLREEIEAAISSRLAASTALDVKRALSTRANDALPRLTAADERSGTRMVYQQYSTPYPVAAAAQIALGITSSDRILEPTAGNGTLISVSAATGAAIHAIELEEGRHERLSNTFPGFEIERGDFLELEKAVPGAFTAVLANPPFGSVERHKIPILNGSISVSKLEQEIAIKALEKLTVGNQSRGFVILPADMVNPGRINDATRPFDTYARCAFEEVHVVGLEGSLYSRMGTNFPTLIYVLKGKRSELRPLAEISETRPDQVPVFETFEDLFLWAESLAPIAEAENTVQADVPQSQEQTASVQQTVSVQPARRSRRQSQAAEAPSEQRDIPTAENDPVVVSETESKEDELHEVDLVNDLEEDLFTRRYEPFSQVGEGTTVIQKTLQGPISSALRTLESSLEASIDTYVAQQLGITETALADRFSPEQVDALALMCFAHSKGRGFLIADLMGVGKGRSLAGACLKAFHEGNPVIFMTEKSSLFSDFLTRDIPDAFGVGVRELHESSALTPVIFNADSNATVRDENGSILFRTKSQDLDSLNSNGIPIDTNFIGITYSQFQVSSGKWKFQRIQEYVSKLAAAGRPPTLLLDEAHKAAGEDSISGLRTTALMSAVWQAGGKVVYSSATPLKSGKNVRLYEAVLPDTGLSPEHLISVIESNPLALQEILSMEMAREGLMISREINSTGGVREFVSLEALDGPKLAAVREKVDRAAHFLEQLVELGDQARAVAQAVARRAHAGSAATQSKTVVETTSPVTQFHHYSQYLMLACKGVFALDMIASTLASGRKVVVALESTGAALLDDLLAEYQGEEAEVILNKLPDIGDVLKRNAKSLKKARIVDGLGESTEIELPMLEPLIERFCAEVEGEDFSLLNVCPIEHIREELESHGIPTDEISGRSRRLERTPDGRWKVTSWKQNDRIGAVSRFNNGAVDVQFLNGSGATGISLHASPKTGIDLRPRTMLKLQLQREVTAERQIEGRINRFGQVHAPEYLVPMTGFAADDRLCQLFNRHNRNLTATSTATRENKSNISEALDLFNPVGENVVEKYLKEHNDLAERLDINPEGEGVVRKLLGRLVCLPIALQESVLADLDSAFQLEIDTLSARGINPLKLSHYDWRAGVTTKSVLLAGDENSAGMGQRPIKLVELAYFEKVLPLSYQALTDAHKLGRELWFDKTLSRHCFAPELLDVAGWRTAASNSMMPAPLDLSHSVFDTRFGRGAADDLLKKAPLSVESAQEHFDGAFKKLFGSSTSWNLDRKWFLADISKLEGLERAVFRAVRDALLLEACSDWLTPGALLALPPDLCPALAGTSIGQRALDNRGPGELAMPVPMAVTGVYGPVEKGDPLSIAKWEIRAMVPGEQHQITFTLSSIQAALEESSRSLAAQESSLDPVQWVKRASLDRPQMAEAFISTGFASLDNTASPFAQVMGAKWLADTFADLDRSLPAPELVSKAIEPMFDRAPAGDLRRSRLALQGNLFMAVRVAGRHFGEKAIFTDDAGNIQHAILLKQGKEKDLLAGLRSSVALIAKDIKATDPVLFAHDATELYGYLVSPPDSYRYQSYFGRERSVISSLISKVIADGDPSDRLVTAVDQDLEQIFARLQGEIRSPMPGMLIVGADPPALEDGKMPFAPNDSITSRQLWGRSQEENDALARIGKGLGGGSIVIRPHGNMNRMGVGVIVSRKCELLKEMPDLTSHASNRMPTPSGRENTVLKGGAIYAESFSANVADLIKRGNERFGGLRAYGGMCDMLNALESVGTELRRRLISQPDPEPLVIEHASLRMSP